MADLGEAMVEGVVGAVGMFSAWWTGGGIMFFSCDLEPGRIGTMARICSVCSWGVFPSLEY